MAPQQCPAFPFGHAAPHAEFDPVVKGIGETLVPHWTTAADPFRHVLLRALHEQRIRVPVPARGQTWPVRDHFHLHTSPSWSFLFPRTNPATYGWATCGL